MKAATVSPQWQALESRIGHRFEDHHLLRQALTHRSAGRDNNERLEFLGDSLVNHVVAAQLFERFPDASEGQLTRLRSKLVRGTFLASLGRSLALAECLVLGAGERKSGGRHRDGILADTVEAVAGAVLLDAGYMTAASVVLAWFDEGLNTVELDDEKDSKTRLQEWLQARNAALPSYELREVLGPDHAQQFEVACHAEGLGSACVGRGSSRRHAEQEAATLALAALQDG
ncbi:MAG: ribonuclease III [Luminiphilus sp.]|nr:ribonuclease III [Luminiphilus sp.]